MKGDASNHIYLFNSTLSYPNSSGRIVSFADLQRGMRMNGERGNKLEYGRPLSDGLWAMSSSSAVSKAHYSEIIKTQKATNFTNITPHSVNINTGKIDWVNPKYIKHSNFIGFLNRSGDFLHLSGVLYNISEEGITIENGFDLSFAVIGFIPVSGDFVALLYECFKWQIKNPETAFRHQMLLKH